MIGNLFLWAALFLSVAVMALCIIENFFTERRLKICAGISAAVIIFASAYLWLAIFQNDFSLAYVASYSSKNLPTIFKISAFWAGQQGSFLLWLLFHAVAGIILIQRHESLSTLGIYYFLQAVLIILVLVKSPFEVAAEILPDGFGLNPLLQDFWMAIHPPIIFLGYALLAVPFAISLGSLLERKSPQKFLEGARVWTLAAWAFLGAGIIIGGFWAYKVLGWGGWWGWDPVENSSLVPYLLAAVLLHLINLAKSKPAVLLMVHLAAIFTYSLVVYGTFLTRSGILGDFSVHSFGESNIGIFIASFNAVILIGGLVILLLNVQKLPKGKMYQNFSERAFLTLLGALVIVFVAVMVWLGMSMPLLTQLLESPAAVDTDFYTRTTAPLAVVIFILLIIVHKKIKLNISKGGLIAHAGVLAGLLAILISASGDKVTKELQVGEENFLLGHKIVYLGQEFHDAEKFYIYEVDGEKISARTKLRTNGEDAAREPAILKNFSGDIYIAPNPADYEVSVLVLDKHRAKLDGDFAYRYDAAEFELDENENPTAVKVKISVTDGDKVFEVEPSIEITETGGTSKPTEFLSKQMRLTGISGDEKKVRLEILPCEKILSELPITATISTKPFMWLLWLSAAAIFAGTLQAIRN